MLTKYYYTYLLNDILFFKRSFKRYPRTKRRSRLVARTAFVTKQEADDLQARKMARKEPF